MDYKSLKKRYVGLDVLRVVSVLVICAFHTSIHLGANYGVLQGLIQMGAVFMTAFFMLSGYSLFVNYASDELVKIENLKLFWIKRIIGIIPMYYVAAMLQIVFSYILSPSKELLINELILAPIEALCLQSSYESLFSFSHNGGTWFISCIMICYLVYPVIQEIAKQISAKAKIIIIAIISFILLYSPLMIWKMGISGIYSNPFFRVLEFSIGVLLASMKFDFDRNKFIQKLLYKWGSILAIGIIMTIGVSVLVKLKIAVGNYMFYSWVCLPCFILALIGLGGVSSAKLEQNRILKYCCSISYVFFLAQLFSNRICKGIIAKTGITNNLLIIVLSWLVCIAIAIAFHEICEKPISRFCKKKLLSK